MKNTLFIIQIVVSILVCSTILLQSRGTGLGSSFGNSSEQYRSKRGVEKILFRATVIFLAIFLISSILNLLIN